MQDALVEEEQGLQPGLHVRGSIVQPLVAIVGTRRPSLEAVETAYSVARRLAEQGIGVVSGLALGIDAAAHRGALAGGGTTVAVLGHGLDAPIYPAQHAALAEAILRFGALASPFDAHAPLTRRRLLARNRWIARLAMAVWVVQSGVPGGALATAAAARQMGIPVYATPWDDPDWAIGYQTLVDGGAESLPASTAISHLAAACARPTTRQLEILMG